MDSREVNQNQRPKASAKNFDFTNLFSPSVLF